MSLFVEEHCDTAEPTEYEVLDDDVTLTGTRHDDEIVSGSGNDLLVGKEGDDTLNGGAGGDRLRGGEDNDLLLGSSGDDFLVGENGDDFLDGGNNDDTLRGGRGNDSLAGNCDRDSLTGDEGNDVLDGGSGDDILDGGVDDDTLFGGEGNDVFRFRFREGNLGVDRITDFNAAEDRLQFVQFEFDDLSRGTFSQIDNADELGAQDAAIVYDASSGFVYYNPTGEGGDEEAIAQLDPGLDLDETNIELVKSKVLGTTPFSSSTNDGTTPSDSGTDDVTIQPDSLPDGNSSLPIQGTIDNEFLDGTAANDTIDGGDGEDYIQGRKGNDLLFGGAGNDILKGGIGDDTFSGGSGQDSLKGAPGNDLLDGGLNQDTLTGGEGADTFRFTFAEGEVGIDTITDFNATEDLIQFAGFAFDDTLSATFAQVNDPGDVGVRDAAIVYDTSSGLVYYNTSAEMGDEEAIAQLDPGLTLDDDNFDLI